MEYKYRYLEDKLVRLSRSFPAIVLCGARQVGKSTLLDHLFGKTMKRVVFDPVVDVLNARQDPELFFKLNPPPVILDEVQYAPELLPVVKRLIDAMPGQNGLFFITGSQQFSVIEAVSESLAGRAAVLELHPMSQGEIFGRSPEEGSLLDIIKPSPERSLETALAKNAGINPRRDLSSLVFNGGYPRTIGMDPESAVAWFDGYLKTYVERDIRTLGNIGDLHLFSRFVKLVAHMTSQEMNYSQLGRDIGISYKTARSWLSILQGSYQWIELPAYSGNTIKRLSGKPKGHFTDSGLATFLSSIFSPAALVPHPLFGPIFETYAVGEIIKKLQVLPAQPALYHWRAYSGAEIDLLIENDGWFTPIEVKLKANPQKKDIRGLNAFSETYPRLRIKNRIVISGGDEQYMLDHDTIVVPITNV